MKKLGLVFIISIMVLVLVACGSPRDGGQLKEVSVGYFPNISHGPAMVAMEKGYFKEELGDLDIRALNFPNGSLFMDALSTGQIDIGYVGPGPAINRYLQGGDVVLIANASIGENALVVRSDIAYNSVKDLEGKIIGTASTGCTHDLLLRKMLEEANMAVEENGGRVKRIAQKPATSLALLEQKQIDGALVSEPWASLMEAEGVGRVVVEARDLPWQGRLAATVLVVRKDFLEAYPELVEEFIRAHERSIEFINVNRQEAVDIIGRQIREITGQEIEKNIIDRSLDRVFFTGELDREILQEFADLTKDLGFIEEDPNIEGLIWQGIGGN